MIEIKGLCKRFGEQLVLNGVDICPLHGWVSAVHSDEDVQRTVQAFEKALLLMQEDSFFS